MGNVFEDGKGDARQSEAQTLGTDHSLFRKRYRQLTAEEIALHDAIKEKANELATLIRQVDIVSSGRTASLTHLEPGAHACCCLAIQHLEDAVYRAVKALTA